MNTNRTDAECKGKLFRDMIDVNMRDGQKYRKLRELDLILAAS